MPANQLTDIPTEALHTAVQASLSESNIADVAARFAISEPHLRDAVDTFRAAGLAALDQRLDPWTDLRLELSCWDQLETTLRDSITPALDATPHKGWWFLRKHPCIRVRMQHADPHAIAVALDGLAHHGHLARWWFTVYEPETAAFGGAKAMSAVHDLFNADSRGVLSYLAQSAPPIKRRELSLLILDKALGAAGLDWFERGDVYARVAELRPLDQPYEHDRWDRAAIPVRRALAASAATTQMFDADGELHFAGQWRAQLQEVGTTLRDLTVRGETERGIRSIFAHIVIFSWNRLGLSGTTQAALARTAQATYLPGKLT